jgi:prolipoprotein diacylglyceryltransferase
MSRLLRSRRFEIRVYGVAVALSVITAWLISSKL